MARRREIPKGPCIVACKHQSLWETFSLYAVLDDPTYMLKRELMWLPLFGWYMRKAGLIPIDRSAGMAALARMTARARQALMALGRARLVIFPEGTRRSPGAEPRLQARHAYLYNKAGVPCVPLALNSGSVLAAPIAAPLARHDCRRSLESDPARPRQAIRSSAGCRTPSKTASARLIREAGDGAENQRADS